MLKEELEIRNEYFILSESIVQTVMDSNGLPKTKMVISVCGESGSGKSVTAICLVKKLIENKIKAVMLNQDGFYHLPPKKNSLKRKTDISWVGPQEVNLKFMQEAINNFKDGEPKVKIGIVNYIENTIFESELDVSEVEILIVEGTFSFLLEGSDVKIFIDRTFKDTRSVRQARNREQYDPFVEKVLQIEHEFISGLKSMADMFISKDYALHVNEGENAGM